MRFKARSYNDQYFNRSNLPVEKTICCTLLFEMPLKSTGEKFVCLYTGTAQKWYSQVLKVL